MPLDKSSIYLLHVNRLGRCFSYYHKLTMNMFGSGIVFVLFYVLWYFPVEGAKILAIFPSPGYSQYFVGEPLLIQLAERGHQITLISFYKPKRPVNNINSIEVGELQSVGGKKILVISICSKTISSQIGM